MRTQLLSDTDSTALTPILDADDIVTILNHLGSELTPDGVTRLLRDLVLFDTDLPDDQAALARLDRTWRSRYQDEFASVVLAEEDSFIHDEF